MDKCPHCGSIKGVYKTFSAIQYYDFSGNPAGYSLDDGIESQKVMVRCLHCDRKISLKRIVKEAGERRESDASTDRR